MKGFNVSILNEIANNLRERYEYDNGFPILKELIQNADDAVASALVFGRHAGFANAGHPLLTGPGLWVWNDGPLKHPAPSSRPTSAQSNALGWVHFPHPFQALKGRSKPGSWKP